ncbi:MAG: hypothetical protein AB2540_02290 [Candidatus Thiodiazotropha endolucinida]
MNQKGFDISQILKGGEAGHDRDKCTPGKSNDLLHILFGGGTPLKHRMKKKLDYPFTAIEVDDYSVHADAGIY